MNVDQRKTANAMGGKTARACDSCLSKRARWFCVADDAFLCQACDVSIHSANQLASRHQRVRLGTSSNSSLFSSSPKPDEKCDETLDKNKNSPPAWHHGFTRKPRTPRNTKQRSKKQNGVVNFPSLVPGSDDDDDNINNNENENMIFCQVPELLDDDLHALLTDNNDISDEIINMRGLEIPEFLSPDMELADFAADVENFLGDDDDNNEALTTITNADEEEKRMVKIETINGEEDDGTELPLLLDWNFGDEELVEEKAMVMSGLLLDNNDCEESMESGIISTSKEEEVIMKKKKMFLRLNYEEVISAWDCQGCPWTDGTPPADDFNPNDYCPDFMGVWYEGDHHQHHPHYPYMRRSDEGREARVTRYREKRRTRLFSKKIRYEVRKLNAEKRPRLKGRFVKRTSFQPPQPFPNYLVNRYL